MTDELATVATFSTALEAETARLLLDDEGITSFVIDGEAATALSGNTVGWVKLKVAAPLGPKAQAILAQHLYKHGPSGAVTCLACGKPMPANVSRCECGWSYEVAGEEDSSEL